VVLGVGWRANGLRKAVSQLLAKAGLRFYWGWAPMRVCSKTIISKKPFTGMVRKQRVGRDGVCDLAERTCRHARTFATELRARGYPVLNDVVLNQVLVSFGRPARTRGVIDWLQAEGPAGAQGRSGRGT
jgi:hypothetical protein